MATQIRLGVQNKTVNGIAGLKSDHAIDPAILNQSHAGHGGVTGNLRLLNVGVNHLTDTLDAALVLTIQNYRIVDGAIATTGVLNNGTVGHIAGGAYAIDVQAI